MGKLIGLALIVLGIWWGLTVMTDGSGSAGRSPGTELSGAPGERPRSPAQRAGDRVRESFQEGEQRRLDLVDKMD